ncbi:dihydrofolate reductase [Notoacmeibacter sp. MSK16QG-6]|uniref:dihydrofolate reductase n=1 Tax=Notoacmeibacter sp. MSK16QG-6 TaxID=2957982 RepID=UPI0020A0B58A|nr:dihydrofolate reductase [Notoacmeibacter sp. MSK16QG-6]MCP1199655.1 dihydrofolate reductase [Notoacmeibacter sp. MSK16QG-6]
MNERPAIEIVVAAAENGTIGRNGEMPWRLSSDLKRFKQITMGCPIVMGRKTFESIGKPLPGRLNVIVTRNYDWEAEGALRAGSLEAAIDLATAHIESAERQACDEGEDGPNLSVCIIGGGEIYSQALAIADTIHMTRVLETIEGDARFPTISEDAFERIHAEDIPSGPKDSYPTRYEIWQRRENGQALT